MSFRSSSSLWLHTAVWTFGFDVVFFICTCWSLWSWFLARKLLFSLINIWFNLNSLGWFNLISWSSFSNFLRILAELFGLALTWQLIVFFWNSLVIIFNQIFFLNWYWCDFSGSTSASLRNFWFHGFVLFLTRFKFPSRFWRFLYSIFSYKCMTFVFINLFLRSILASLRLA